MNNHFSAIWSQKKSPAKEIHICNISFRVAQIYQKLKKKVTPKNIVVGHMNSKKSKNLKTYLLFMHAH